MIDPAQIRALGRWGKLAWLPLPLLSVFMALAWAADSPRTYGSLELLLWLNATLVFLPLFFIGLLAARGFLDSQRPGLLMFGCASLLWGVASLLAASIHDVNVAITVYNIGVCGSALCHLGGLWWRTPLRRPARWLGAGYLLAPALPVLVASLAAAGRLPVFFIQGQGGTPVRHVVLVIAAATFGWVAWMLLERHRRQTNAFYYWYGLGLALVTLGIAGLILLTVKDDAFNWITRGTQYFASIYLFVAAIHAVRGTQGWKIPASAVDAIWNPHKDPLEIWHQSSAVGWLVRYGFAVGCVAGALLLRWMLESWTGASLPPYITFFPAVMLVVVIAGFGPGMVANGLFLYAAIQWVLPNHPAMDHLAAGERVGLIIFAGTNVGVCAVAEIYRHSRRKVARYVREAALHHGQARLAAFAQATFEGIVETEHGRIVDGNEQVAKMLGYPLDELRGKEVVRFIVPEDRGRVLANIASNQESWIEHRMLRRDGSHVIVEARGRPVSPHGAVRHTALRDITELRRAQHAVEAERQLLGEVVNHLPACICVIRGSDLTLQMVNPAYQALCPQREMLGRTLDELWPEAEGAFNHLCRQVIETGQPFHAEDQLNRVRRTPAGPVDDCYFTWSLFRVHLPGSDGWGILNTAFETTARKKAEQELSLLNRELEERVTIRTHELQTAVTALQSEIKRRRRLEREILEISEREQSRLGQDLHDGLGQELAGIAMLSDVLARQLEAQKNPMTGPANQIAAYVRAAIDPTRRLAKGHYPIELNRYGLYVALKSLADQTAERTGIRCQLTCAGEWPALDVSTEIHLYRIVQECISNAVKHGKPNHITVELTPNDEDCYIIAVSDDGIGCQPAPDGPGMGLHLMQYRARLIGADIAMDQPPAGGCRVTCRLRHAGPSPATAC